MLLIPPPKPQLWSHPNPVSSQLADLFLIEANISLYITIMGLENRVNPDTQNIIAALSISMLLLPPPKSQNIDLPKPDDKPVVV